MCSGRVARRDAILALRSAEALNPQASEASDVGLVHPETVRMPALGQPVPHLLGTEPHGPHTRVISATNPIGELLVARQAATILRRAGHLALQTDRIRWGVVENLFDHQHVLPPIAEVVVKEDPIALGRHHLVESYLVLSDAFVTVAEIEPGDEVGTSTPVHADPEPVQMTVLPAHRDCNTTCNSPSMRAPGRSRRRPIGGLAYIRSTLTRKPRTRSGTSRTCGVGSSNIPANASRPAFATSAWSNARSTPRT